MQEFIPPSIRKKLLARIIPLQEEIESQNKAIRTLTEALDDYSREINQAYSFIEPQGSTGKKQTQLRGAGDIDLFVGMDPEDYRNILDSDSKQRSKELDRQLEFLVDKWFVPALRKLKIRHMQKTYSQHPYLSLEFMGNDVDILVCFDLSAERLASEGPITAVDRTVHHTRYVSERITERLREDVRILKSFARASHVYADACAIGQMGFTGYSLEILILQTGSLKNALMALNSLEECPIDPLKRDLQVLRELPQFRDNSIFIIDPTDTNRNVASSFSDRSYRWLRKQTAGLLEVSTKTDEAYFDLIIEKPVAAEKPPNWFLAHSFVFEFESDGTVHYTVLRDKLHRLGRKITSILEHERTGERRFGEILFEVYFERNHYSLGFVVESPEISSHYSRKGPPIDIPEAEGFRRAHSEIYEIDGYLWVEEKRDWTRSADLTRSLIKNHGIRGLKLLSKPTDVSARVLNILYSYILPLEQDFPLKATI
ncbi:MAG: hypothetical protein ACFFEF_00855 [Candidatus Thorarchaeota archaeon]